MIGREDRPNINVNHSCIFHFMPELTDGLLKAHVNYEL